MKKHLVTLVALVLLVACAKAPPTLSPAGSAAFHATRVVKALDVLRDTAIDANAEVPPLVSEDATRKIVLWHKSAVTVIGAAPGGWKDVVVDGLTETRNTLPPDDRARLGPYFDLVSTLIQEVTR